jgi:hypothetical protein
MTDLEIYFEENNFITFEIGDFMESLKNKFMVDLFKNHTINYFKIIRQTENSEKNNNK